jgi:hypothetical protein
MPVGTLFDRDDYFIDRNPSSSLQRQMLKILAISGLCLSLAGCVAESGYDGGGYDSGGYGGADYYYGPSYYGPSYYGNAGPGIVFYDDNRRYQHWNYDHHGDHNDHDGHWQHDDHWNHGQQDGHWQHDSNAQHNNNWQHNNQGASNGQWQHNGQVQHANPRSNPQLSNQAPMTKGSSGQH